MQKHFGKIFSLGRSGGQNYGNHTNVHHQRQAQFEPVADKMDASRLETQRKSDLSSNGNGNGSSNGGTITLMTQRLRKSLRYPSKREAMKFLSPTPLSQVDKLRKAQQAKLEKAKAKTATLKSLKRGLPDSIDEVVLLAKLYGLKDVNESKIRHIFSSGGLASMGFNTFECSKDELVCFVVLMLAFECEEIYTHDEGLTWLMDFVVLIRSLYQDNSYHCFRHAADVTQCMFSLLNGDQNWLGGLESDRPSLQSFLRKNNEETEERRSNVKSVSRSCADEMKDTNDEVNNHKKVKKHCEKKSKRRTSTKSTFLDATEHRDSSRSSVSESTSMSSHSFRRSNNNKRSMNQLQKPFTDIERFALLLSCLCHDAGHNGTTNAHLAQFNDEITQVYPSSYLENHHLALAQATLASHRLLQFFDDDEDRSNILRDMESVILATDMELHTQHLEEFESLFKTRAKSEDMRTEIKCMIVKLADISNVARTRFDVAREWTVLLFEENFALSEREKFLRTQMSLSTVSSPGSVSTSSSGSSSKNPEQNPELNSDLNKPLPMHVMVSKFCEFLVKPMFKALEPGFPHLSKSFLQAIDNNLSEWNRIAAVETVAGLSPTRNYPGQ